MNSKKLILQSSHWIWKRLLNPALNLFIDRFIGLFTVTVQLFDFGFFFFFQIAITLKRKNKIGLLDSCPFLFHTAPANYTQKCNPKFLHLLLLDHPAFAASKGQAAARSDVRRRYGLESSKERGHETFLERLFLVLKLVLVGTCAHLPDIRYARLKGRAVPGQQYIFGLIEALKKGKVRE